ncbi:hypothetical protein [Sulfurimonas sp.]|uniref:hypothetical protein n=1 Tax=Sulfurimonas sp. TaxID=2022749 RepID=UPI002AB1AB6E|nr:hypothetical protein [Sulfurimonas sp.]
MKFILALLLLFSISSADKMKKKTLACPTVLQLQKVPMDTADNYLNFSMYAISNNCVIVSKRDDVEAIGYDPLNSKEIYQKIIYQRTGVYLYIIKSSIQIEQEGKKSTFRF